MIVHVRFIFYYCSLYKSSVNLVHDSEIVEREAKIHN